VTDVNDHDAGLVVLYAVDDAPRTNPDPKQVAAASEHFDLRRCRVIGEIVKSATHAVSDGWIKRLVLLAGTRG
jgi:hypothetical protein